MVYNIMLYTIIIMFPTCLLSIQRSVFSQTTVITPKPLYYYYYYHYYYYHYYYYYLCWRHHASVGEPCARSRAAFQPAIAISASGNNDNSNDTTTTTTNNNHVYIYICIYIYTRIYIYIYIYIYIASPPPSDGLKVSAAIAACEESIRHFRRRKPNKHYLCLI